MATREQIIKAILDAAGNPDVGIIKDLASTFADAVVAIDQPPVVKETRVQKPEETR